MNRCDLDDRLTRARRVLIVLAQTPIAPQPGERPLHHPATPQRHEPPLPGRPADHHQLVAPMMHPQPAVQLVAVILVVRLHLSSRENSLPGIWANSRWAAAASSTLAAVTTTASSNPSVSTTICRLRPRTFLPPSVPTSSPPPAVLTDWLSMQATRGEVGRPAAARSADAEDVEEAVPGAVPLPGVEVVVDGPPGGEVMGQGPPSAALAGEVEDGVDDLAHVGFTGPAAGPGRGDLGLQDGPLGVGQVGRV